MLLKRLPPLRLLIRRRLNWSLAVVQPWGRAHRLIHRMSEDIDLKVVAN